MTIRTLAAAALLAAGISAAPAAFAEPQAFEFDRNHTAIRATWNHFGLSNQSVQFTDYEGTLILDFDNPENSTVDITFNLDGMWAGVPRFEAHMKSADMFEIETWPTARFVGTSYERTGDNTGVMSGDLTIRDNTHPVSLDVTLNYHGPHPLPNRDNIVAGFSATGTILRSDFGVDYAAPLVSDEVTISIETELRAAE
ncbi:MAG: YceI family protein [Maricaulaceae bacterium]|nr:YceI family protein [Maricaulaceae bacterium]